MSALVAEADPLVVLVVVAFLVFIAMVWVGALLDAIRVPDDSLYRSGSRTVWVLVVVFLGIVGAVIYWTVGAPTTQARQRFGEVRGRKAGSLNTSPTASANTAPGELSGPTIVWTHAGVRFLAGYTVQDAPYYGIWDRSHPGPPILKFPYTEHGKAELHVKYRGMEPNGHAVPDDVSSHRA
jgi:hypothetical protein